MTSGYQALADAFKADLAELEGELDALRREVEVLRRGLLALGTCELPAVESTAKYTIIEADRIRREAEGGGA